MSTRAGKTTTGFLAAVLLVCSCTPESPRPPTPLGLRDPLRPGHWRGAVNSTLVDFHIDRVSATEVAVHVSGSVKPQVAASMGTPNAPLFFADKPRSCAVNSGRKSFDCTRYVDMHIDNGFLCGNYELPDQTLHPCFPQVP